MQRRELFSFLSSSLKTEMKTKEAEVLRPPYFRDANAFFTECQKCEGDCASACQEKIISIGADKTPFLDFSLSGCTYCDDCALACGFEVLNVAYKKRIDASVSISERRCLSWQGVMCFSCKDPCLEDAIEFKAMFMPTINMLKCTACGFCISRCPSYAIEVK